MGQGEDVDMAGQERGRVSDLIHAQSPPHPYMPSYSPSLSSLYRVKAEIEQLGEGELAFFELPEDDVVLDKEYKITYKVRIGKGVDSGLFVFPTFLTGPGLSLIENLEVLVK